MYKEVKTNAAIKFLSTKPTIIITTLHENMKVNAGVFGAYTNLSSEHIGIAVSPRSDTYKNIKRTKEWTISVPPVDIIKSIRILADKYPEGVSEVEEAQLSLKSPITNKTAGIEQCVAAVECALEQMIETGSHIFVIGKVTGGWIKSYAMTDEGRLDIFKGKVFKDFCYPKPLYVLPGEIVEG